MLTKFYAVGTYDLLSTGNKLEARPAYVYKDGQRTNELRRDHQGRIIRRLVGALPLIDGEVVADGYVYVTNDDETFPAVSVGSVVTVRGGISVRAARGFGLTVTVVGEVVDQEDGDGFTLSTEAMQS